MKKSKLLDMRFKKYQRNKHRNKRKKLVIIYVMNVIFYLTRPTYIKKKSKIL